MTACHTPSRPCAHVAVQQGKGGVVPLSAAELSQWLDTLADYTHANMGTQTRGQEKQDDGRSVHRADNPLFGLPVEEDRVDVRTWVEAGKCRHAPLYMAQIQDKLQPWSNGGTSGKRGRGERRPWEQWSGGNRGGRGGGGGGVWRSVVISPTSLIVAEAFWNLHDHQGYAG